VNLFRPSALKRALFFLFFDIALLTFSFYLSYLLRFNFEIPQTFLRGFFVAFPLIVFLKVCTFYIFKIYFVAWRFFGLSEAKNILKAMLLAQTIFAVIFLYFYDGAFPRSVIFIDFFISSVLVGGLRISKRFMIEKSSAKDVKPTIIIGATTKAANIIKSYLNFNWILYLYFYSNLYKLIVL